MALVVDTGPLYASLDRRDGDHVACLALLAGATEELVIPSPVLVEVDYLLQIRGRSRGIVTILDDILSRDLVVEEVTMADYLRVRQICERYADLDVGFVDAAVLAIVERLNEPKLATLDHRHFGAMQARHVDSLQLLPE